MTRWPRDRIKHYPAIAMRYDKNLASFRAAIKLIAFRIWSPSIWVYAVENKPARLFPAPTRRLCSLQC